MTTQSKHDCKVGIVLATAGILSGALTSDIDSAGLTVDATFGVAMSVALAITGVSRNIWKAPHFIVVFTGAHFISVRVAFVAQLAIPETDKWSMGHNPIPSPLPLFFRACSAHS
jgi:hypothetical protein